MPFKIVKTPIAPIGETPTGESVTVADNFPSYDAAYAEVVNLGTKANDFDYDIGQRYWFVRYDYPEKQLYELFRFEIIEDQVGDDTDHANDGEWVRADQ
jgi:hypothetical protein